MISSILYTIYNTSLKGSVVPDIFPLVVLTTLYGYAIVYANELGYPVYISNSVIPALSVVLGLLLAFRANTSYARYYEGRQLWETLTSNARNLSRLVWLSIPERTQSDHLEKMRCMKLILAFAVSTKHHLRHEYGLDYYDLDYLLPPHWIPAAIKDDQDPNQGNNSKRNKQALSSAYFDKDHLSYLKDSVRYGKRSNRYHFGDNPNDIVNQRIYHHQKTASNITLHGDDDDENDVQMNGAFPPSTSTSSASLLNNIPEEQTVPNEEEQNKNDDNNSSRRSSLDSNEHHHHFFSSDEDLPDESSKANMSLPLEILFRMSLYMAQAQHDKKIDAIFSSVIISHLNQLNDCLAGLERLEDTPIPKAYNIHLKQSLWLYLVVMPFTIVNELGWWLVPTCVIISFILYGIDAIGAQIENPFGYNGNDLPLNQFCDVIRKEIEFVVTFFPCEATPESAL
ncbi:unnamed protein product [Cunninghamella blakesleeana]